MLLDSQLAFSEAQALTATAVSTNVVTLVNPRDMGIGTDLYLMVTGSNTFASAGGTATLVITVQFSNDNVSYSDALSTPVMTITELNSTAQNNQPYLANFCLPRPEKGNDTTPLYIRLNYTVGTQNFTVGTVSAYLTIGRDEVVYYPSGYTVTV
jgi:hypothetical protein